MAVDIDKLKVELAAGHPDTGAYDADDSVAADELNAVNRTRNKTAMTGSEVFNAITEAHFTSLQASKKQEIWDILHLGNLDPFGLEADRFVDIFGAGASTIITLQALRVEDVSRAVEQAITSSKVRVGEVQEARA